MAAAGLARRGAVPTERARRGGARRAHHVRGARGRRARLLRARGAVPGVRPRRWPRRSASCGSRACRPAALGRARGRPARPRGDVGRAPRAIRGRAASRAGWPIARALFDLAAGGASQNESAAHRPLAARPARRADPLVGRTGVRRARCSPSRPRSSSPVAAGDERTRSAALGSARGASPGAVAGADSTHACRDAALAPGSHLRDVPLRRGRAARAGSAGRGRVLLRARRGPGGGRDRAPHRSRRRATARRSTRWRSCSARPARTRACSRPRSIARGSPPSSPGARGGPTRPGARFLRCSTARSRSSRRGASRSTCRSARCRRSTPTARRRERGDVGRGRRRGADARCRTRSTDGDAAQDATGCDGRPDASAGSATDDSDASPVLEGDAARAVEVGAAPRRLGGDRQAASGGAGASPGSRPSSRCGSRSCARRSRTLRALAAIERDLANLEHLERFALPVIERLAALPAQATWGEWIARARRRSRRWSCGGRSGCSAVLAELRALGPIGPVALDEVRDVLAEELATVAERPPVARYGRVFVGTLEQARGRAFDVVFIPGLAERIFPQKPREDPILLDALRRELERRARDAGRSRPARAPAPAHSASARRRGARICPTRGSSWRRRGRACRRSTRWKCSARWSGASPTRRRSSARRRRRRGAAGVARARRSGAGHRRGRARPGEPGRHPARLDGAEARGRARYLLELNDRLARSLRTRWARWRPRFTPYDGIVQLADGTRDVLLASRPNARAYSVSALQRFAACPYQFYLSAICRLAPREEIAPARAARSADARQPLPRGPGGVPARAAGGRAACRCTRETLPAARACSTRRSTASPSEYHEKLAPAIERVWDDEVESLRVDLRTWLDRRSRGRPQWEPFAFELAFGLPAGPGRGRAEHPRGGRRSTAAGACAASSTWSSGGAARPALRVTDHKTGLNRTAAGLVVGKGEALQPVLYGLAVEQIFGQPVAESRLVLLHAGRRVLRARRPDDGAGARAAASRSLDADRPRHRAGLPSAGASPASVRHVRLPPGLRARARSGASRRRTQRALEDLDKLAELAVTRLVDQDARDRIRDVARRDDDRRGRGGHGQDQRAGGAARRGARGGARHRADRRRGDVHREGGGRAEAAAARGAGAGAPGGRAGLGAAGQSRRGGGASGGGAPQHDPRLLQRPPARAPGGGAGRPALRRAHRARGGSALPPRVRPLDRGASSRRRRRGCGARSAAARRSTTAIPWSGSGAPAGRSPTGATSARRGAGRPSTARPPSTRWSSRVHAFAGMLARVRDPGRRPLRRHVARAADQRRRAA